LCFDFGLEGSRKAGVSLVTCSNPQALFCALGTARKRITKILSNRGASNDLPTHEPDTDPGRRRAAERGHEKNRNFSENPLEIASPADYCKGKELENSESRSGRCFRQGNKSQHLYLRSIIGLGEGCTRKDRRTSSAVFSTSSSPFLCPRENGSKKQSITFAEGGNHDLPTHEPDTDPGRRRAAERGHEKNRNFFQKAA
jgi:hypothetical protein